MIDLTISQDKLVETIRASHLALIESRQVSHRLRNLLESFFRQTKSKLRGKYKKMTQLERQALNDAEYLDFVEKIAHTTHEKIKSRVDYETHLMLFQARQSLRNHPRRR